MTRDVAVIYTRCGTDSMSFASLGLEKALDVLKVSRGIVFVELTDTTYEGDLLTEHLSDGRPALTAAAINRYDCVGLCISISHNEDVLAVAYSYSPIGLDVERADRKVGERLREWLAVDASVAVRRWTECEAVCKLAHIGIWQMVKQGLFEQTVERLDIGFFTTEMAGDLFTLAFRNTHKENMIMEQKIISIIANQLGKDAAEIRPEQELIKDLRLDSIDMAEILGAIEDEFPELEFVNAEIKALKTVADILALVAKKVG